MEAEASWQHEAIQPENIWCMKIALFPTDITWIAILESSRTNCDLATLALGLRLGLDTVTKVEVHMLRQKSRPAKSLIQDSTSA